MDGLITETCHASSDNERARSAVIDGFPAQRMGHLYGLVLPLINGAGRSFCVQ
jgi:hypothetical protein